MRKVFVLMMAIILGMGVVTYVCSEDMTSSQVIKLADNLLESENYERAIEEYLKLVYLLKSDKYSAEAEYKVGICLQRNQKYWRAIKQCENVVKKYPATEWAKKARDVIKVVTLIIEDVNSKVQYPVTLREKIADSYVKFGDIFAGRAWVYSGYKNELEKYELESAKFWYEKVASDFSDTYLAPYALEKLGLMYFNGDLRNYFPDAGKSYMKIPEMFNSSPLWAMRGLRLAADIHRDKMNKKDSIEIYERLRGLADEIIGEDSFYRKYAETQLKVVR